MTEREVTLRCLLNYSKPIRDLKSELAQYEWDCDFPLIVLTAEHIKDVLSRYAAGKLSEHDVEEWANLVELRDDIGFEGEYRDAIRSVLYELANPYLTEPLTRERTKVLSAMLRN